MPTMLNIHEAKVNFSGVLAEVENKLTVVTIMRYGRPVGPVPEKSQKSLDSLEFHGGESVYCCRRARCARGRRWRQEEASRS